MDWHNFVFGTSPTIRARLTYHFLLERQQIEVKLKQDKMRFVGKGNLRYRGPTDVLMAIEIEIPLLNGLYVSTKDDCWHQVSDGETLSVDCGITITPGFSEHDLIKIE